jgi:hypothetical protein
VYNDIVTGQLSASLVNFVVSIGNFTRIFVFKQLVCGGRQLDTVTLN